MIPAPLLDAIDPTLMRRVTPNIAVVARAIDSNTLAIKNALEAVSSGYVETTDWNTATTNGNYTAPADALHNPTNHPTFGTVAVLPSGAILQRVQFANVIYRQEWIRHKYGTTWTGWQEISNLIQIADWDDALTTGEYLSLSGAANAPGAESFYIGRVMAARVAFDAAITEISQTAEFFGASGRTVFNRYKYGAEAWSAWDEQRTSAASQNTQIETAIGQAYYEAVVVAGFNTDVVYDTGDNLVPNFVTTSDGDIVYGKV